MVSVPDQVAVHIRRHDFMAARQAVDMLYPHAPRLRRLVHETIAALEDRKVEQDRHRIFEDPSRPQPD